MSEEIEGASVDAGAAAEPVVTGQQDVNDSADVSTGDSTSDSVMDSYEAPESETIEYDGGQLTINYDPDLAAEFNKNGLDIKAVTEELYNSKDFSLSKTTHGLLSDIYGKAIVDNYIFGLKAQKDQAIAAGRQAAEEAKTASDNRWSEALDIVGGEAVWDAMEKWANSGAIDKSVIDGFNQIMEHGDKAAQDLAIKYMMAEYRNSEGDDKINLLKAENTNAAGKTTGAMSFEEYKAAMVSGEYYKNPELYDAMRRKGQEAGI